jgi:hypothetical protein
MGTMMKLAGIGGMTYDPNNANVKAMQKKFPTMWKTKMWESQGGGVLQKPNVAPVKPIRKIGMDATLIHGFFDELEAIEKEGGLKGLMLGGAMLASLAGGGKMLAKKAPGAIAKGRPGITQIAKRSPSRLAVGGSGLSKRPLEVQRAMNF